MANESYGYGDSENCSPELVSSCSEAGCHFELAVLHCNKDEGVSGKENNLKWQWVVVISSGKANSRAVCMGKRIHVPRKSGCC